MRLSDLLRYTVVTTDGTELGVVSDIRLVQDGPIVQGVQAAFRVDSLVVGRGGIAERLGYVRGRVQGPWMLRAIFTRLEQRVRTVDIADIDSWDDDALTIRVTAPRPQS